MKTTLFKDRLNYSFDFTSQNFTSEELRKKDQGDSANSLLKVKGSEEMAVVL